MNVKMVLAVALASGALACLGGCASMSKKGDSSAMVPATVNDGIDEPYVQAVNDRAHESGVRVVWVNPPDKARRN